MSEFYFTIFINWFNIFLDHYRIVIFINKNKKKGKNIYLDQYNLFILTTLSIDLTKKPIQTNNQWNLWI
jgi:hypothetical protein